MIINIKNLLNDLISYTIITDSSISSQGGAVLYHMREAFKKASSQKEMIALFFGGTLYAMHQDETKYGVSLGASKIVNHVEFPSPSTHEEFKRNMLGIGNYILENLPNSLTNEIYRKKIKPRHEAPKPYFPNLELNLTEVELLLNFCKKYGGNLEKTDIDTEEFVVEKKCSTKEKQFFQSPLASKKAPQNEKQTVQPKQLSSKKTKLIKPENVENIEKLKLIVDELRTNITQTKNRVKFFTSNISDKYGKLTTILKWLSKQTSIDTQQQQVLIALIGEVTKEKRNCLGLFSPHSFDEFQSLMKANEFMIPEGIKFGSIQNLASGVHQSVTVLIDKGLSSIPANVSLCAQVDITEEDIKNAIGL
ncbi:MAG: hypothetical protein H0U70_08025 [Tatlockia sp.]|nr:hypothetical protein [Tatlockia sp.]